MLPISQFPSIGLILDDNKSPPPLKKQFSPKMFQIKMITTYIGVVRAVFDEIAKNKIKKKL